jgi:phosphoglycolate phosphatase-like HAD superfamily hydrolase
MLILFDIDGTLLSSQRAGTRAMAQAARVLFGEDFSFDNVEIAGRLDPLIWADAARANGINDPEARHDDFRQAYVRVLNRHFKERPTARALPGVVALIDALRQRPGVTLGLLTGNYPESGTLKITAAGLALEHFAVAAWGHDGPSRRDLPPVAMARLARTHGRTVEPDEVVIIGDTRHDIDCAAANGCRSIGVATGTETLQALQEAGADLAVESLADTAMIVEWIFERS